MARDSFVKIPLLCYSQNRLGETLWQVLSAHVHCSTHALQHTRIAAQCITEQCIVAHMRCSTCIAAHMLHSTHASQNTCFTAHMHCSTHALQWHMHCSTHVLQAPPLQWARFTQIKSNVYILIKCDTDSFVEMILNCMGMCLFWG